MNNDPFKLLNVPRNFTLEQLRAQYKRIALQVHPDKGGSDELFQLVTHAYKKLLKYYHRKIEKDYHDLKEEFKQFSEKQPTGPAPVQSSFQEDGMTRDKFNTLFEEQRLKNAYDEGYGERMAQSSGTRESVDVPSVLKSFKIKQFNKEFDKQAIPKENKKLMVYRPPEPVQTAKQLAYSELGVDRIKDYSGENESLKRLNYMDYMKAHSTTRLIDPNIVNQRTEYRSVDELESARAKNERLTPAEERALAKQEQRAMEAEKRRQETILRQEKLVAEQYMRINRSLGR